MPTNNKTLTGNAEYLADNRLPIFELLKKYHTLVKKFTFSKNLVFQEKLEFGVKLPVYCYCSPKMGPSLWIIAGIHGKEPAGPNALAKKIELIGKIAKNIPIVFLPLCNPRGYFFNQRFPNLSQSNNQPTNQSVGDTEHYLPNNPDNPTGPRAKKPSCLQSDKLTKHILQISIKYPPILTIDLHEDIYLNKGYIYSQGPKGNQDPVAKKIIQIFASHNQPIFSSGSTRFGERISSGIVGKIYDGSIDELLASKSIYINHKKTRGPSSNSVITIVTSTKNQTLAQRQQTHEIVMENIEQLWKLAINNSLSLIYIFFILNF